MRAWRFSGYRWPGNIRELQNVIERMIVLSTGDEIDDIDLPEEIRQTPPRDDMFLTTVCAMRASPRAGLCRLIPDDRSDAGLATRVSQASARNIMRIALSEIYEKTS
jgi:DNA-binding NtrC family response regulator